MSGQFQTKGYLILHLRLHLPKCNIAKLLNMETAKLLKRLPKGPEQLGGGQKK